MTRDRFGTATRVDVVAAVITRSDGSFLLAQRPPGKVYAGYWEVPGGKIESGETALEALIREIREELGIEVLEAHPWLLRRHDYEHAAVRLRFFRVTRWRGEPVGLDGQRFEFQHPGLESVGPMLPANGPILKAVALPPVCGITDAGDSGIAEFLERLDVSLARGLRMVQVRDKALAPALRAELAAAVVARCHAHNARVLINADSSLALSVGADGVHLTARQLAKATTRPAFPLVGASVHSADELDRARDLGCDFAFLGPVLPTPTHPGGPCLGWDRFAAMMIDAELPVYALGGLAEDALTEAFVRGAHGIAMMRGAWRQKPR